MTLVLTEAPQARAQVSGKRERIMARKKFSRLLRLMKYAREANLQPVFLCRRCHEPVKLKLGEGTIEIAGPVPVNEKTDTFSLSCRCTRWTVR